MALSATQRKANDKYIKNNYKRVALSMPKEESESLERYCKSHGRSKAGFIRELIQREIMSETVKDITFQKWVKEHWRQTENKYDSWGDDLKALKYKKERDIMHEAQREIDTVTDELRTQIETQARLKSLIKLGIIKMDSLGYYMLDNDGKKHRPSNQLPEDIILY